MNEMKIDFEAAELVPKYWDLTVEEVEDILFLGQVTIRQMIRSWRSRANEIVNHIKRVEEMFQILEGIRGKGAAGLCKLAKSYENPKYNSSMIGLQESNWSTTGKLEPLDKASRKRKRGVTTFNVCGWCKYAGGGLVRYNYHISTSCSFQNEADGFTSPEKRFDTLCFLKEADNLVFVQLRLRLAKTRVRLVKSKREVDAKIRFLLELEKKAERKPALADHRPHDWFNIGEPLLCYISKWERANLFESLGLVLPKLVVNWLRQRGWLEKSKLITFKKWAGAFVIDGYRHHDGCVSVRYTQRVHSGPYLEGRGGSYGMSRPEVIHAWEFDYLRDHLDFAKVWMMNVPPRLGSFNPAEMLEALTKAS